MFDTIFKTFKDPALELKYNEHALNNVKRVLFFSLLFFGFNTAVISASDILVNGKVFSLVDVVFLSRSLFVFLIILIIFFIKYTKSMTHVNYAIAVFYIMLSITGFMTHFTKTSSDQITYALELTVIIAIFLVFPVCLKFRLFGAVLFTILFILALEQNNLSTADQFQTTLLLFTANVSGFAIARYLNATLRRIFLKLENYRILRAEVDAASSDLVIAKGIIPICASCKKIRDDTGFWDQLESYFKRISNVDFIGQKCPTCIEKESTNA